MAQNPITAMRTLAMADSFTEQRMMQNSWNQAQILAEWSM